MNMEKSNIYAALAKAQSEFSPVVFDKVNPHFKSKFGSIAAINKATLGALTKNGLSITQPTKLHTDGIILLTRLGHESGEIIESEILIKTGSKTDQQIGASLSYMRRYCHSAIINVVAEEEDDGEEDRKAVSTMNRSAPKKEDDSLISAKEVDSLEEMTKSYPSVKAGFLQWAAIDSYSEVKSQNFQRSVKAIQDKINKLKEVKNES